MRPISPQPKPQRAPKKPRQPIRRGKPFRRSWMRKGTNKTKHARRPREWGYMAFCHARGCELCLDVDTQQLLGIGCHGSGPLEFAHLSAKKRYDVGDVGACLHQATHRGIDGRIGGKLPWYVALGKAGQLLIRQRLSNRARRDWDALTPAARERWEEIGRARLSSLRASRRR